MARTTFRISGMHCTSCELLLKDILSDYGAREIKADHRKGTVSFSSPRPLPLEKVREEIEKGGYALAGVG